MEFMFGTFAFVKVTVAILIFLVLVYEIYTERYKAAIITSVATFTILFILSFFKYDGTDVTVQNVRTEAERSALYKEAIMEVAPVETHKTTFKELMKLETSRSQAENQQIQNEIKGN